MLDIAKRIAFAGRADNDVSKDADEFWEHTGEVAQATYLKMAEAVSGPEYPDFMVLGDAIPTLATYCTCCNEHAETTVVSNSSLCSRCTDLILIDRRPMSSQEAAAWNGLVAAQQLANSTAVDAGWYTHRGTGARIERNFGEVVALMHSELSEALEADRKGLTDDKLRHRDGREVEFADVFLRIGDTGEDLSLDIASAFIEKNRFNQLRNDHKAASRNATGGKKY